MLKRMEYYHSNKNTGGLTAEIINKTIVTFIAASFVSTNLVYFENAILVIIIMSSTRDKQTRTDWLQNK